MSLLLRIGSLPGSRPRPGSRIDTNRRLPLNFVQSPSSTGSGPEAMRPHAPIRTDTSRRNSMSTTESIAAFVRDKVASRFDQMAADLQKQLDTVQRQLEDLRAARGSMKWQI